MKNIGKRRLRSLAAVLLSLWALTGTALADGALIPGGEPIGIQIAVEGVLVAETNEIETPDGCVSPAREAGLRPGDVIVSVNGEPVDTARELSSTVESLTAPAELTVLRDGRQRSFLVTPVVEADGTARLGLWLRDGISGIGTVTYIDPETGAFGALGHGVNEPGAGALLPLRDGSVCRARIVDVKRGVPGAPGELAGQAEPEAVLGRIERNTDRGIFGVMTDGTGAEPVPVAEPEEVHSGPATIRACVGGGVTREYRVEIARTGSLGDSRELTVRVTDPALLEATGGIVQGMSGSPILQDGKLVGAVTHVLVSDPTRGYGVTLRTMLAAAA